jgi:outer membrane protein OmpA-like peptidoglycan-associated protein
MIVTAEPYFAVTQPSDAVVLENFVRSDTKGIVEQINAKYELLKRGQYTLNVAPTELQPIRLDKNKPLDLYEAQNAVRIARWNGADRDAGDSYARAESMLQDAERIQAKDPGSKGVSTTVRGSVQAAEDARLIALQRQEEARLARERAEAAEREAQARAAADQAVRQQVLAEEQQRLEAERRARAESERARAQAEAEKTRAEAELAAEKATREREAAQAEIQRAEGAAEQAQREQQQLREQLVEQFNRILETRDTARGLIVIMSDVLFDTGKYDLKPGTREKLAKISGIVLAHPGLKLEVEGHTDNVGSDVYNEVLSERRCEYRARFPHPGRYQPGVHHRSWFRQERPHRIE